MEMMLKLHMMWGAMILFFVVSLIWRKQIVTVMLLRLSYLIMIGTGIGMLINMKFPLMFVVKGLLALVLISLMEVIVGQARRGLRAAPIIWVLFIILLVLIPSMGYGYITF